MLARVLVSRRSRYLTCYFDFTFRRFLPFLPVSDQLIKASVFGEHVGERQAKHVVGSDVLEFGRFLDFLAVSDDFKNVKMKILMRMSLGTKLIYQN